MYALIDISAKFWYYMLQTDIIHSSVIMDIID